MRPAASLLFGTLAHYSTDRFWMAAMQAPLSIALFLASLLADLRSLRGSTRAFWRSKALSGLLLVASGLAYEVVLPLFLLNPVLIWLEGRRHGGLDARQRWRTHPALLAGWLALFLASVVAFKLSTTVRMGTSSDSTALRWRLGHLIDLDADPYASGLNIPHLVTVTFGEFGVGLPTTVAAALRQHGSAGLAWAGLLFAIAVAAYLWNASRTGSGRRLGIRSGWGMLFGAGALVFTLGYAIFLINDNIVIIHVGIGNRVAIAATVGVALMWVALIGGAVRRLRPALAAGGTLIVVSHDLNGVRDLCTRAVWLDRGRVLRDGRAGPILDEYLASA